MMKTPEDSVDVITEQWTKERPELASELDPMGILGRFARIYQYAARAVDECHQDFGLKSGEFDVLATLRRSGEPYCLTPSALFHTMMLSSGAMTNRLDKLAAKGLIKRVHSNEDRRSVMVSLTPKGFELIDVAIEKHLQIKTDLLKGLTKEQTAQLGQLLKIWLKTFEG